MISIAIVRLIDHRIINHQHSYRQISRLCVCVCLCLRVCVHVLAVGGSRAYGISESPAANRVDYRSVVESASNCGRPGGSDVRRSALCRAESSTARVDESSRCLVIGAIPMATTNVCLSGDTAVGRSCPVQCTCTLYRTYDRRLSVPISLVFSVRYPFMCTALHCRPVRPDTAGGTVVCASPKELFVCTL